MNTLTSCDRRVKTARKPRPRPVPVPRLTHPASAGLPAQLQITMGRKVDHYEVACIPSDWGLAYAVSRLTPGGPTVTYHCCVSPEDWNNVCDCKGFLAHGHCKHLTCLVSLMEQGLLGSERDAPPPEAGYPEFYGDQTGPHIEEPDYSDVPF
jgi:hypothetical protein